MGLKRKIRLMSSGIVAYTTVNIVLYIFNDSSFPGEISKTSSRQLSRTARQLQNDIIVQTSRTLTVARQLQTELTVQNTRAVQQLQNGSLTQNKSNDTASKQHKILLPVTPKDKPILQNCTVSLSNLREQIQVNESYVTMAAIRDENPEVQAGGHWRPKGCSPLHKIAILVPFRDRHLHLSLFLRHMHPFLQKQLVDYTIYVVEQTSNSKFNRGFLFNVGVTEALKDSNYDCFFFHDVDTLPENERNIYHCPQYPTLYASAVSKFEYLQLYEWFFGCVTVMRPFHYRQINGYSNEFLGWGAEDDDFSRRMNLKRIKRSMQPPEVGRYHSVGHPEAERNPDNDDTLNKKTGQRLREGLNSTEYRLKTKSKLDLYTWLLVEPLYNETAIIMKNVGQLRKFVEPQRRMSELEALKLFKSQSHAAGPEDVIFKA